MKTISAKINKSKNVKSTFKVFFDDIFLNQKLYGLMFSLGGLGIWVYQIYYWLQHAKWEKFSLLRLLSSSSDYQDWVFYPTEWIGIHKILDFIPLSIIIIIIGLLLFFHDEY